MAWYHEQLFAGLHNATASALSDKRKMKGNTAEKYVLYSAGGPVQRFGIPPVDQFLFLLFSTASVFSQYRRKYFHYFFELDCWSVSKGLMKNLCLGGHVFTKPVTKTMSELSSCLLSFRFIQYLNEYLAGTFKIPEVFFLSTASKLTPWCLHKMP